MIVRTAAALAVLAAVALGPGAAAAATVPFADPGAVGPLTLCDTAGRVATHGDIHTKPFAWRAVGSAAAPKAYSGTGRTASLFAFQPIKNVYPTSWYGQFLTAGATYSSKGRPMAAATAADPALADVLANYPTKWDGLVQLRMALGAPQLPTYGAKYNAAVIRVHGNTWTLVQGGRTGCDSGTATSSELILPKVRALGTPQANATTDVPARPGSAQHTATRRSGSSDGPSAPGSSNQVAAAGTGRPGSGVRADASHSSSGSGAAGWIGGVVVVLGLVAGLVWRRTRSPRTG